jgi:DNA-binding response OmpR family regulator
MLQNRGVKWTRNAPLGSMEPLNATILVVEDHCATRTFLADNLTADGYDILEADSVSEALHLIETKYPDLALIDLGLPDSDGLDLISTVRRADRVAARADPDLPMVILSGRSGELAVLRGFDRGCDDFVAKPFDYQELRARIGALLRRTQRRPMAGRIRVGALELDPMSRQVWVHGEPVRLSKKEYGLLRVLASRPTLVFSREELLDTVWGYKDVATTRTLDSHAGRLRKKLCREDSEFVINVWGIGYRLVDGGAGS